MTMDRILNVTARLVGGVILLAAIAFCGFGFLASFEHPGLTVWHVAYAGLGLAFTGLLCLDLRPLLRRPPGRSG